MARGNNATAAVIAAIVAAIANALAAAANALATSSNTTASAEPNYIIIPLLGQTGAGKSTFINAAAGKTIVTVGHGLDSCTTDVEPVVVPYPENPDRSIVFIDTPGFNNTFAEDTEIVRRISGRLAQLGGRQKVAGIIYLYDISESRTHERSRKNVFEGLCGKDALKKVILGTTKWDDVEPDVAKRRERQLENHWKDLFDHGARMTQFHNSKESAWAIVDLILHRDEGNTLSVGN